MAVLPPFALTPAQLSSAIALLPKAAQIFRDAVDSGDHEPALQAFRSELAAVVPLIESVTSMLAPGAGVGIEAVAWALRNSRPMTQAQTNAWMDRQNERQD